MSLYKFGIISQITDPKWEPRAFHQKEESIDHVDVSLEMSQQQARREVCAGWWLRTDCRFIIVPYAQGRGSTVRYMLRVYADTKDGLAIG